MSAFAGKKILIIIENLPVPFDRRVWQEATALKEEGADVSIICPKMKGYKKSYEQINNIKIYRHPLEEADSLFGYLKEYFSAIFWQLWLTLKLSVKNGIFDVIHGCNPPDLIFITALPYKIFGTKYVFDHHDINPELYVAKYRQQDFFYKLLQYVEKLTFKTADYSIATNKSYKKIAVDRGGMNPDKVKVVRSGPSLERLKIKEPDPKFKKGRPYLVGYVGVIGEQEGLDLLLKSIDYILEYREDIQFAIIGNGPYLKKIKKISSELGIQKWVDFYGRVTDERLLDILNTCDICVNPDRPTTMNNLSTMNKIMEYMALKKPIVQYDLKEGRESAQLASLYAKNADYKDFGDKIVSLVENEDKRNKMGEYGRNRVLNTLQWKIEKKNLISFYEQILDEN